MERIGQKHRLNRMGSMSLLYIPVVDEFNDNSLSVSLGQSIFGISPFADMDPK